MKNFGKFTLFIEDIEVDGDLFKDLHFLRNEAGQNLVEVLRAHPHPFYIAVDDAGVIVSMESDPEQIQIPDHEIIGIDSDYGFTNREGGTVYGAIWDGQAIIAPPPHPLPPLTARQFWQAALVLGITEDGLVASISNPQDALYIEDEAERASVLVDIRKATSFRRDYPLIDEMAAAHNLPQEQMDDLWVWAAQIE